MHRFWNSIIEPMINILRPNSIVEISFNHEYNTINLLKYCVSNQAILHVIDPLLPKHEISKWQKEYGDHLVFHQLSSLNALPHIDRMDMVFIDGDHNWYTVFNELKLIDKFCKKTQCIFPLIMLHDVGWPYGRRDLYYHPETIPVVHQKPYKQLGVKPNSTELIKNGGLNSHLYNSIYENNIQNGVLTAVEDFLESSNLKLEFIKIPVLFGLGILFPLHLKETNQHFKTFIDQFYLPEAVSKIMEQLETMRLESEIDRQETQAILTKQAATHQEEVTVLRRTIDGQFADLHTKDKTLSQLQERIAYAKQQENQLRKKIERLHAELTGHQQKTEKLHDELTGHKQEIERQHTELTGNEKERARLHAELQTHKIELLERDKEIERLRLLQAEQKHRLTAREQDIRQYQLSNQQLRHWLEQLNQHTKALLESWRWKSGNLFIRSIEKTLLRSKVPLAADHMQEILKSFENQANHPAPAQAEILPLKIISKQTQSTSRLSGKSVDIVICVHNALDDVRQCLNSVVRHTPQNTCRIIIVNDGSDIVTSTFLRKFATRHQCTLIESPVAERYTKAANKGLKASTADYVVLLNSDTIVPEYWLDRLIECGESDPEIGIIGPLSNAATYQSVPNVREGSDWSLNPLPNGFTVDDMARIVEKVSEKRFPSLPFINGFCYVIKRAVIDKIGYLDQETFPNGYGEENDFSFRTRQAGFRLAIADNTYVYHAKSKSYGHKIRKSLTKNSHQSLFNKHGPDLIKPAIAQQNQSTVLEYIRNRLRDVLSSPEYIHRFQKGENLRVLWLLMDQVERGDDFDSIMHDSEAILGLGIHSEIAIHRSWRDNTLASHPFAPREMFYCYDYESQLLAHAANFDIVVATHSKTVAVLERICKAASGVMPAYFIQDYEPTFLPEDRPDLLHQAKTSYTAIPHMVRFAKTDWIRKIVQQHHNVTVAKVAPSLDTRLYYPWLRKRTAERHAVHIVAMVKPASPLRAPKETMLLLGTIQQRYLDNVDVTIFGNDPTSSDFLALPQDFTFENHGLLSREAVADLINTADIFVDMSKFQSFGRTGLEAMALGCATILPKEGGVHEYAVHEENALIIDTHNMDEAVAALDRLIRDEALRTRLANNGILTASHYAASTAALSEVLLFREALKEWLVTIIVPIFNTYDEIQACIDSLLSYTNHPHRLVLIDDCSSDTRIWPMLQSYAASYYHITALRNTTHLGYAQTINKGCQMAEGDVVLLNSNTEVSPGWLSKLREASRSRNNIATVTALSNSAGAFSVPENNKINPLPAGFTVERMAALVEQYSPKLRPEVPTGNGFCMYVTRKAMQAVGLVRRYQFFQRLWGSE